MSELANLEQDIADAERAIARREAALRLEKNPDFKMLYVDGYFMSEAARLIQLSTDLNATEELKASSLAGAQATGYTKQYHLAAIQMGVRAEQNIGGMKDLRIVMLSEPDEQEDEG